VNNTGAVLAYYTTVQNGAFGNYRDLMRAITLNPAMGRYLNMINSRSQAVSGVPANENYARELMQLFTIGTLGGCSRTAPRCLDSRGAPPAGVHRSRRQSAGADPHRLDLRRRQPVDRADQGGRSRTGAWPMEPVARFHDVTAKTFLGEDFPAGADGAAGSRPGARPALRAPERGAVRQPAAHSAARHVEPEPGYVPTSPACSTAPRRARGDIAAVVRAILTHPEANRRRRSRASCPSRCSSHVAAARAQRRPSPTTRS
jgi:uncharacterized protein (DUF1800 family)